MKGLSALVLFAVVLQGSASSRVADYLYFPEIAASALAGDRSALRQVLSTAEVTQPGEQLEELAEISSRFVRLDPTGFVRAQADYQHCFGVGFMGADYVDNPGARLSEVALRRKALESVQDPSLAVTKAGCLAAVDGS